MSSSKKPYSRVRYDWSPEKVALLGTMSDTDVAEQIGGKVHTVAIKRQELGIACYKPAVSKIRGRPRPNFNWTQEALSLIGTMADKDVASRLGLSTGAVGVKRRSLGIAGRSQKLSACAVPEDLLPYLGVWSDAAIASKMGVRAATVNRIRRKLQIQPVMEFGIFPEEAVQRLGTMQDLDLAKEYSVTAAAVWKQRKKRGIPRFRPPSAHARDQTG
ncbi:hypothetical protein F2S72_08905 [Pseudomonas syringae pv. actinidiae]|nr:hypothetical protein [Pseudomonas syringae pv. actinidiae]